MKFRTVVSSLTVVSVLAVATPGVSSAQNFYSTGANVNGLSQDVNWMVAAQHVSFGGEYLPAYIYVSPPRPLWIANNTTGSNGGIGAYEFFIFRQTFDLTGFNPATAVLQFKWGCDDDLSRGAVTWNPDFVLNSGSHQGAGTCGSYDLGGLVTVNSGFITGLNTLDFYVVGNGQTDGMILQSLGFTAQGDGVVPEPATMTLLATGLASLAAMRRRKKD